MVRRRSTVRFRNGAPGQGYFFERIERAVWTESWRRSSAPIAAKAPIAQREPGRQLLKAAAGGLSRDSLAIARVRSRWVGRPAAGRFQASMSRINIQDPPGGCRCHPARQAGRNECLDHAVRVRDVLQLDGLRQGSALYAHADVRALRICIPMRLPACGPIGGDCRFSPCNSCRARRFASEPAPLSARGS